MMEQQIRDAYENLPEIVKKAIADSNWSEEIGRIGKKFNLRLDQTAALENNVTLIMLGLLSVNEFIANFKSDMEISVEDVQKGIISDLEKNIFAKIRTALVDETSPIQNSEVKMTASTVPATQINIPAPEPISIITPQEQTIIEPDPIVPVAPESIESRSEILSQIENPVKTETQLVNKTQVTAAPIAAKPLTAPIAPSQPKPARVDPYREPIV